MFLNASSEAIRGEWTVSVDKDSHPSRLDLRWAVDLWVIVCVVDDDIRNGATDDTEWVSGLLAAGAGRVEVLLLTAKGATGYGAIDAAPWFVPWDAEHTVSVLMFGMIDREVWRADHS